MKDDFIQAIHNKNKLKITYFVQNRNEETTRRCAPTDYGPRNSKGAGGEDWYHFYDYDGTGGPHTTSILPQYVKKVEVTDEAFDPGEFVPTYASKPNWHVSRDWGEYS